MWADKHHVECLGVADVFDDIKDAWIHARKRADETGYPAVLVSYNQISATRLDRNVVATINPSVPWHLR